MKHFKPHKYATARFSEVKEALGDLFMTLHFSDGFQVMDGMAQMTASEQVQVIAICDKDYMNTMFKDYSQLRLKDLVVDEIHVGNNYETAMKFRKGVHRDTDPS